MKKYLLVGGILTIYYIINYFLIQLALFRPELKETFLGDNILYFSSMVYTIGLFTYFWVSNTKVIEKQISLRTIFIPTILMYLYSMIFDIFYRSTEYQVLESISFNFSNLSNLLGIYLLIGILGPLYEELFFRGILLNSIKKDNVLIGTIFISFFYALSHFYFFTEGSTFDYIRFLNLFILGCLFSIISLRYGVLYAIISHISYNTIVFLNEMHITDLFILDYIPNNVFNFIYLLVLSWFVFLVFTLIKSFHSE